MSGSQHDQLLRDYEDMMTNPDGILHELEEHFKEPYDAEEMLGDIVKVR